ncbi:hypothetical protein L3X38_003837 [Prunus dulcis]|uniref:Uncharacterized protein n=1 Tax=Prunus dulcis TaxID=3755 RepID=A0AAD4ZMV6_PRUDU|nr:hypothetical protein L3X38_003837 [Prunus dulcis]
MSDHPIILSSINQKLVQSLLDCLLFISSNIWCDEVKDSNFGALRYGMLGDLYSQSLVVEFLEISAQHHSHNIPFRMDSADVDVAAEANGHGGGAFRDRTNVDTKARGYGEGADQERKDLMLV